MAQDAILSRELKSLQEELSTSQRERAAVSAQASAPLTAPAPPADLPQETQVEKELHDQLRELMDEAKNFFTETEKNISAHPAESVVGALLVGILIGRLLGRR
jgi:ElaB/YqjD/DUF883 family membrane-anchored ribosome-binding protein